MTISDKGLELIKEYEGFRSKPYLCKAGVPTIGYGTTHYQDGRAVTMHDKPITKYFATLTLKHEVSNIYGRAVNHYVRVPLNQNQFDALVSFVYNAGVKAFKTSTMLRDINDSRLGDAGSEFKKWIHIDGRVDKGLINRRKKERKMWQRIA